MNYLLLPSATESKPRRKSASDLYKHMNVSRALSILKISEREYRELTDIEFREAFTRRQTVTTGPTTPVNNAEEATASVVKPVRTKSKVLKNPKPLDILEANKLLVKENMKKHEAFQFLVKRRSSTRERKLTRQETGSTFYSSVGRGESVQSWGSQDLGDVGCSDIESPVPKRRGSISPYLVGPGTPPPIDIPGLAEDEDDKDSQEDKKREEKKKTPDDIEKTNPQSSGQNPGRRRTRS